MYEGEWTNDHQEGTGTKYYPDGYYVGQWINDRENGQGRRITAASTYEGQWLNGQRSGQGKTIYSKNQGLQPRDKYADDTQSQEMCTKVRILKI